MEVRQRPNSNTERVPSSPTLNKDKSWGNAQCLTPFMLYLIEHRVSRSNSCAVGFGPFGSLLLARESRLTLCSSPFQRALKSTRNPNLKKPPSSSSGDAKLFLWWLFLRRTLIVACLISKLSNLLFCSVYDTVSSETLRTC